MPKTAFGAFVAFPFSWRRVLCPCNGAAVEQFVIVPVSPNPIPVNVLPRQPGLFGQRSASVCIAGNLPGAWRRRMVRYRMTWRTQGRDIAHIHRTRGGGIAWEQADMECRPAGSFLGPIRSLFIRSLRYTYFPTVRGQRQQPSLPTASNSEPTENAYVENTLRGALAALALIGAAPLAVAQMDQFVIVPAFLRRRRWRQRWWRQRCDDQHPTSVRVRALFVDLARGEAAS